MYDDAGHVLTVDNSGTPDLPNVTLTQTYDGLGNLASLNANVASTDVFTNNYTNDTLGQMTQVTRSGSGVSSKGATFAYNPLGRFTTVATFASITTSDPIASSAYGYDDANQLTSLTHTKSSDSSTIAAYGFTYDANGQLTAETNPDGSIAYTYDHDGRLTGASGTALPSSQGYAYDANNNRTSTTVGSTTNSSLATAGNNQLATDGTYDYAYDLDGNLITKTTISTGATENFAWDYRNRLTDITYKNSEGTTTQHIHYTYDVFNRRITQEIDSTGSGTYDQVEHYVYDPAGNLLMTLNGSGAVTHVLLNGPASNQVLADDAGSGNVTWMLADQQGSVRDVLDSTGAVIDHIEYDPYGNILTQSSPTDQPRFLYAGMQLDSTGLYFDNARYYDPSSGTFISTDPTGFAGGSGNLYGYVNADPTNFVDPSGLSPKGNGTADDFGKELYRALAIANGASVQILKGAAFGALLLVAPELAIPLLLDFAALDFANRIDQGFSGGNALLETGADISGVNGLSAGIYNQDILGNNLNLSDEARAEAFTGGLLQAGGLGYGLGELTGPGLPALDEPIAQSVEPSLNSDAGPGCFVAGTLVLTAQGKQPIDQIRLGQRIVAGRDIASESGPKLDPHGVSDHSPPIRRSRKP